MLYFVIQAILIFDFELVFFGFPFLFCLEMQLAFVGLECALKVTHLSLHLHCTRTTQTHVTDVNAIATDPALESQAGILGRSKIRMAYT